MRSLTNKEARKRARENLMFVQREDEILLKFPGDLDGKQFK